MEKNKKASGLKKIVGIYLVGVRENHLYIYNDLCFVVLSMGSS